MKIRTRFPDTTTEEINVDSNNKIIDIKKNIIEIGRAQLIDQIRIIYAGRELSNELIICNTGLDDNCQIHCIVKPLTEEQELAISNQAKQGELSSHQILSDDTVSSDNIISDLEIDSLINNKQFKKLLKDRTFFNMINGYLNSEIEYDEIYKDQLEALNNMGFIDVDKNTSILNQTSGNIDSAIAILLVNQDEL